MTGNTVYKTWGAALLMLCSILPIYSQPIDLFQSLEVARQNYPSIRAKTAQLEANVSEYQAQKNAYIPRLTLHHQYTYSTGNSLEGGFYPTVGTLSPSGGIHPDNDYTATYGSFTTALVEWDIFSFGKIVNQSKAAQANMQSSQANLENEIFQHQVRVADAYLLLLMAENLTRVQEVNEARARSFSQAVNAAVNSQLRAEVDGLMAQSEFEKARVLLLQSRQLERTRRLQLMELLGMEMNADTLRIDSMNFHRNLPDLAIFDHNILENPLLRLQAKRIEAASFQANAFRSSALPTLSLVAAGWARGSGVSNADGSIRTDFSSGTEYQVKNYLLGISARWTITDGFTAFNRYKKFQSIATQHSEAYNQQQLALQRQLNEAQSQYQVMQEQAEAVQLQLNAAQRAYAQAQARYQSGLTDLPTLLQSMVAINQAEADKAITYSNAWRALLAIALAQGDLPTFLSQVN